jgi:hypothetical protein
MDRRIFHDFSLEGELVKAIKKAGEAAAIVKAAAKTAL